MIVRKQFGKLEYLSYIGGILGLLVGISLLSLVEIFYFSSLHLLVLYRFKKKRNKVHHKKIELKLPQPITLIRRADKIIDKVGSLKRSTVHSFNIIGNTERTAIERWASEIEVHKTNLGCYYRLLHMCIRRLFWLIVFLLSTMCCGSLVSNLYEKLEKNPISISLEDKQSNTAMVTNLRKSARKSNQWIFILDIFPSNHFCWRLSNGNQIRLRILFFVFRIWSSWAWAREW